MPIINMGISGENGRYESIILICDFQNVTSWCGIYVLLIRLSCPSRDKLSSTCSSSMSSLIGKQLIGLSAESRCGLAFGPLFQ